MYACMRECVCVCSAHTLYRNLCRTCLVELWKCQKEENVTATTKKKQNEKNNNKIKNIYKIRKEKKKNNSGEGAKGSGMI